MNKGALLNRRLHVCVVGPRRGFQKLHSLCEGLTVLYATRGRKSVDTTDDPALEHVCGVADAGAVSRDGRHSHAMLVRPRQTSDPRLISTDAAVMMYDGASASFGRKVRRVNRGIRTANNDGTVCFWRKLYHAINHQNKNVHWEHFRLQEECVCSRDRTQIGTLSAPAVQLARYIRTEGVNKSSGSISRIAATFSPRRPR